METWLDALNTSPLPVLLNAQDKALDYFVRRDLLRETAAPPETLWHLPEADRLIKKQQGDGSWKYAGKTDTPAKIIPYWRPIAVCACWWSNTH